MRTVDEMVGGGGEKLNGITGKQIILMHHQISIKMKGRVGEKQI